MTSTSSLTTEPKDRPADRKSQTSILTAIESCGGFSGALVTFQCMVQRVYCKRAKISKDKTTNYRYKHAGLTQRLTLQKFNFSLKQSALAFPRIQISLRYVVHSLISVVCFGMFVLRCTLLNQDLKSVAKSSKKDANEEIR